MLAEGNDKYLNNVFMHDLLPYDQGWEVESFGYFYVTQKQNMFKQSLLKIYKNVTTIVIHSNSGLQQYPLSFSFLLETIKQYETVQKVIIKAWGYNNWISSIWNKSKPELLKLYKTHKMDIIHKIEGMVGFEYDCIVIKKQIGGCVGVV